jgi:hypothetical protein
VTFGVGRALFGVAVGLNGPGPQSAPPPPTPIRVVFEAPAECSSQDAFLQGVRARTERVRVAEPDETAMEIHVELILTASGAHGELRMQGEQGQTDTRRVDGGTCDEIVEALSLTAALAIDPAARVAPLPPPAPPPPPPPVEVPPPPPPPPPPPEKTSLGLELGAKALVAQVVAPFTNFGGEISARVRFRREGSAEPSIGLALMRSQNDLFGEPRRASVRLTAVALTACPARWNVANAITLEPCALGVAGWLGAAGKDLSHTNAVVRTFYGAGGSLTVGIPIGKAAIDLTGGFTMPLARRRFVVGIPPRHLGETPVMAPIGGIGLHYEF